MRKKHLDPQSLQALLTLATQPNAPPSTLLFAILATTAMRAEELSRLRVCDIDAAKGSLRIQGAKGSHDRHLYLPPRLLDAVLTRTACLGLAASDSIMGLLHDNFKQLLTPRHAHNAKQCLREHWRALRHSIDADNIPLHGLRHTVAVTALENGLDLRQVQSILGHKNINNTIKYLDYVNSLDASKDLLSVMSGLTKKVG